MRVVVSVAVRLQFTIWESEFNGSITARSLQIQEFESSTSRMRRKSRDSLHFF